MNDDERARRARARSGRYPDLTRSVIRTSVAPRSVAQCPAQSRVARFFGPPAALRFWRSSPSVPASLPRPRPRRVRGCRCSRSCPTSSPGPNSLLSDGHESMVVAWQTYADAADFSAEFGSTTQYGSAAVVTQPSRAAGHGGDAEQRFNWTAVAGGLALGRKYYYRVRGNGQVLAEGYFTTRQPRGRKIRFVAFGDNSYGDISDRAIAYHAYQQHPDFVMNCGDNVYESGLGRRVSALLLSGLQRRSRRPREGAPLLRSVPFYTVIANHDVQGKDANGHEIADFSRTPDSLAYYTAMHLPLNGPAAPVYPTPTMGPQATIDRFRACAGARFPRMANYSFDYGDAHFLCLDSNLYIDPNEPALQAWIAADLDCHDGALEVRRLPPSAVQRRRRALRGAAHARPRAAVRGAWRRYRAQRPRAQLPAAASAEVRPRGPGPLGRSRRRRIAACPARSRSTATFDGVTQHAPGRRALHRDRRRRQAPVRPGIHRQSRQVDARRRWPRRLRRRR